jgi:hypothetical protein
MRTNDVSYLYIIRETGTSYCKVGHSAFPEERIAQLQTGNPRTLQLVYVKLFPDKFIRQIESALHSRLKHKWCNGEWFEIDSEKIVDLIRGMYGRNSMDHT